MVARNHPQSLDAQLTMVMGAYTLSHNKQRKEVGSDLFGNLGSLPVPLPPNIFFHPLWMTEIKAQSEIAAIRMKKRKEVESGVVLKCHVSRCQGQPKSRDGKGG